MLCKIFCWIFRKGYYSSRIKKNGNCKQLCALWQCKYCKFINVWKLLIVLVFFSRKDFFMYKLLGFSKTEFFKSVTPIWYIVILFRSPTTMKFSKLSSPFFAFKIATWHRTLWLWHHNLTWFNFTKCYVYVYVFFVGVIVKYFNTVIV